MMEWKYIFLVVPFSPLPGCNSADLLLDLWTHGCLHSNHANVLKGTTFIVQASKCVHTRDVTPAHTMKNLAVFMLFAGVEPVIKQVYSMYEEIVENKDLGESILIEVASHLANPSAAAERSCR